MQVLYQCSAVLACYFSLKKAHLGRLIYLCTQNHEFVFVFIVHSYKMYVELALAVVLGTVAVLILLKKRQKCLDTEDGWWGVGTPLESPEDDSIRLFRVETTQEEIEVN